MTRILALEAEPGALTGLADADADVAVVADLDDAIRHLGSDPPPDLVAVAATWPQPLTTARRLRRVSRVGLALLVPEARVPVARTRLALAPEITNAVVLADDVPRERLAAVLAEAASAAAQRGRLRQALDAINRDVIGAAASAGPTEPAAAVSAQYLAAVVDHAPDVILSVDPAGRVVSLNEFGERLLRTTSQQAEGNPLAEILPAVAGDGAVDLLTEAGRERGHVRREVRIELGADVVLLSLTAAAMHDPSGSLLGYVIIGRDITRERQSLERLRHLQRAESLATLAGGVAHDFNNLLVGMQGWASIARSSPGDVDLVDHALGQIMEASTRAAELARAMLAYSGRGSVELTSVDLNELVAGMTRLLRSSVSPKTRLELELADELARARADASQLRQVLMNLVINAAEAIGDDTGTISVGTALVHVGAGRHVDRSSANLPVGEYLAICVTDDGPGIGEAVLDRIFEPFFSTKFAGRGLGLAASAGIMAAHGGAIEVEGRPGLGARFRVLVPLPGGVRL
ncbi:MAG TPA: ATP-binding protein [Egicoccus sp.]|nr:ATP-binding protein [Egicoccus sp.]HSK24295.1 ATP-binding protein [Egicoccus sp.]